MKFVAENVRNSPSKDVWAEPFCQGRSGVAYIYVLCCRTCRVRPRKSYPSLKLRVFVDDITALLKVRNKELVEMAEKVFNMLAVGVAPTERLKLRKQMAAAAGKKESVSLSPFLEMNGLRPRKAWAEGVRIGKWPAEQKEAWRQRIFQVPS